MKARLIYIEYHAWVDIMLWLLIKKLPEVYQR